MYDAPMVEVKEKNLWIEDCLEELDLTREMSLWLEVVAYYGNWRRRVGEILQI
jgi:hypothetical protein